MKVYDYLEYINKRISKIEDKDPNYLQNQKWIELRQKQEMAFKELAKAKLEYFEFLCNKYISDEKKYEIYKKRADECKKYLEMGEKENETTL